MPLSRRVMLSSLAGLAGVTALTGTGYALVENGTIPGKGSLDRDMGRCDATIPAASLRGTPGPTVTGSFASKARGRTVDYAISYPPGPTEGLPVCLALHGYHSTGLGALTAGNYPTYLAGAVRAGALPFAIAAPDGGNTYWHPHPSDDPMSMLVDEFLPLLAQRGLNTDRLAVAGWSMGGYGALLCGLTWPTRFRTIVASSPAIFHSYRDAHSVNPDAYTSQADWDRYDLTPKAARFKDLPISITIGNADPFAPAVRTFRDHLPDRNVVHFDTGCHDTRFWTSAAPAQVRAISTALTR